ncbi:MAG: alpha/beta hydrolase domain-containing protein [Pseudohongiellaceae bacterium]
MCRSCFFNVLSGLLALSISTAALADVSGIDITERKLLEQEGTLYSYESISGIVHYTLDPNVVANQSIIDIANAPVNEEGLVEFSADYRLLVPRDSTPSGVLLYNVNNRGGSRFPPEISLTHPLSEKGHSYLATGWINEISSQPGRLRLHAPIVKQGDSPITGEVRYEVTVGEAIDKVNVAGAGHLAYRPTEKGLVTARLSKRKYQNDQRTNLERAQFDIAVSDLEGSNQPQLMLSLKGGFEPGVIYELIYEAQDPVLAGAGLAGIRDLVSLIKKESQTSSILKSLPLPPINTTVAWGNSQSGRLLRQFIADGFNADEEGDQVFDGIIPVIAGGGYGMFNLRFAMPTRTNGQHSNHLYPNDLFPFTYGESRDPFSGHNGSILAKASVTSTTPKIMHIQTTNEYWVRAGSLPHTNPEGTRDISLLNNVRFYTIGGSQHGSGNGRPRPASNGQLPPNPNMWAPFSYSLISAMVDWVKEGKEPPPSKYPKISEGSLVASHEKGSINPQAWRPMNGFNHPKKMYQPALANYGEQWREYRIISSHPQESDKIYKALVPAVDNNNNDLAESTILPPLTQVPLATFVSWNLRAESTGSSEALARLSGGYIPLPRNAEEASEQGDFRDSVAELYSSFEDYINKYEVATDELIQQRYLLPEFKETLMNLARANQAIFDQ